MIQKIWDFKWGPHVRLWARINLVHLIFVGSWGPCIEAQWRKLSNGPLEKHPTWNYYFTPSYKEYKYPLPTSKKGIAFWHILSFVINSLFSAPSFTETLHWLDHRRCDIRISIQGCPFCKFGARWEDRQTFCTCHHVSPLSSNIILSDTRKF